MIYFLSYQIVQDYFMARADSCPFPAPPSLTGTSVFFRTSACFLLVLFEIGTHHMDHDGLEFTKLLHLPPFQVLD